MAAEVGLKQKVLNFNVGVLGHIDSGKTSLSKALSTNASTASFDKNPQSRERGITLDLGFSSFTTPVPQHLQGKGFDFVQYTLVDCPGHASLIKTIIGGAQIIDLMLLVVDATKGIQTQTAECLIIGEITCQHLIVVVNKVDLIKEDKRQAHIEKLKKKLSKTLESTKFSGASIIPVAAKVGGPESVGAEPIGMQELVDELSRKTYLPDRTIDGPLVFSVDHCFSIKGQGTVMTGTVLNGSVSVNDTVEIPSMKVTKKVKSMQIFRQPVNKASQGDRVGICVTQFDPKLMERGLVCSPGFIPAVFGVLISVQKIGYFKGAINSKSKFHITIGHDTVMGRVQFFGTSLDVTTESFDFSQEYKHQDELFDKNTKKDDEKFPAPKYQLALIEFEKPVTCPKTSLVIGSRLDTDIHLNTCRLAFHGKTVEAITDKAYPESVLPRIKVYKFKSKEGVVERMTDEYSVVGKNLFKKETNIQAFMGLKVKLSNGEDGVIEGGFGQSGKFKVRIPSGLLPATIEQLKMGQKKKGKAKADVEADEGAVTEPTAVASTVKVILQFKRYIYDAEKKMTQV